MKTVVFFCLFICLVSHEIDLVFAVLGKLGEKNVFGVKTYEWNNGL